MEICPKCSRNVFKNEVVCSHCGAPVGQQAWLSADQSASQEPAGASPFDPRVDISADARHIAGRIVKHLWIIFVLLPCIFGLLYLLASSITIKDH